MPIKPKRDFTTADGAVDKFFTPKSSNEDAQDTNNDNIANNTKDTYNDNNENIVKVTHKSKHYDIRGKRAERFGLLLDEQLKTDMTHLSRATGSRSVNDFIITVLLEYVERPENQSKLEQYRKLLQG